MIDSILFLILFCCLLLASFFIGKFLSQPKLNKYAGAVLSIIWPFILVFLLNQIDSPEGPYSSVPMSGVLYLTLSTPFALLTFLIFWVKRGKL